MEVSPPTEAGVHFSQADHAVNAAISGAGALLGRISMTEGHLAAGQLVMPFKQAMRANAAYRIVCPPGAENRPQVAQFIEWVRSEVTEINARAADREFVR